MPASAAAGGPSAEQPHQLVGLAEHRVVPGVHLRVAALEALGGPALVRLSADSWRAGRRIATRATSGPRNPSAPWGLERRDRVGRVARQRPRAGGGSGPRTCGSPPSARAARRHRGHCARGRLTMSPTFSPGSRARASTRERAGDAVGASSAAQRMTMPPGSCRPARYRGGPRRKSRPAPLRARGVPTVMPGHLVGPLRAAVERQGRRPRAAGRAQTLGHRLPDPAALIGSVNQHVGRHRARPSRRPSRRRAARRSSPPRSRPPC
jgi:hypothetical protein